LAKTLAKKILYFGTPTLAISLKISIITIIGAPSLGISLVTS
jgi:hypothetical protein